MMRGVVSPGCWRVGDGTADLDGERLVERLPGPGELYLAVVPGGQGGDRLPALGGRGLTVHGGFERARGGHRLGARQILHARAGVDDEEPDLDQPGMNEDAVGLLVEVAEDVVRDRVLAEARLELSFEQHLDRGLVARFRDVVVGGRRDGRRRGLGEQLEVDQAVERGARRAAPAPELGGDVAGVDRGSVDAGQNVAGVLAGRGRRRDIGVGRRPTAAGDGAGEQWDEQADTHGWMDAGPRHFTPIRGFIRGCVDACPCLARAW